MSDDDPRARSRAAWEDAAVGWGRRRDVFQSGALPVSAWMVEAIAPQPGHVVLELAAGPGDTGFMAAELIHPGGRLITTDGSPKMLEVARARADELGIRNVEFSAMEAEWIDLDAASVDGVLCRWGYMLLVDPEAALRDTRRVLRPGGTVALAAWAAPEDNPVMTAGSAALAATPLGREPQPGEPGPFAFSAPGVVDELLGAAGFVDATVDRVELEFRFASLDEAFEVQRDLSPNLRAALPELTPADHTHARDAFDAHLAPFVQAGGEVVVPGATLVASASA